MSSKKIQFKCNKCPAYCCSYPEIPVNKTDIRRLAKRFDLSFEDARKKFTKWDSEHKKRIMRHREDEHYGTACRFLDPDSRNCTIYKFRPAICRDFPGTRRCGYYDFLTFERRLLEDPDYISTTDNV